MTSPTSYEPHQYWEERLSTNFALTGVGLRKRGAAFNQWSYQVRLYALKQTLQRHPIDPRGARICEVGCGTGFYIPFWLNYQPRELVGWDITQTSVEHLREQFPSACFEQRDISQPLVNYGEPGFDLVTVIDVLFHVTHPAAFEQALTNLGAMTKPGGIVLLTDYFWRYGTVKTKPHVCYHSLAEYEAGLEKAGLKIEGQYPQTFVMNAPLDNRNLIKRYIAFFTWTALSYLGQIEAIGNQLGKWAYNKDIEMINRQLETPSTKIMVCRKA
jgi:SAM-dependent methyltransferase